MRLSNMDRNILSEKNFWIIEALQRRDRKRILHGTKQAAVLIPIYESEGELYIVFTKRTNKVIHHKGQISFPGGVYERCDVTLQATALRESFEEVGVRAEDVYVIGVLDDETVKSSGYVVMSVVGIIPHPYQFTANAEEVDCILEVPIARLSETEGSNGVEYLYEDHRIWGLTARIVKQLLDLGRRFRT